MSGKMIDWKPVTIVCLTALAIMTSGIMVPRVDAMEAIVDGVAAMVDGKPIMLSDVQREVAPRLAQMQQELEASGTGISREEAQEMIMDVRKDALNDLINRELIIEDFKEKGLSMPDYILEDHIRGIIRENFENDRRKFLDALKTQGLTLKSFREQELDKIIVSAMRGNTLPKMVVISPKKLQEYYSENRDEFSEEPQVRLRMITVNKDTEEPGSSPETQKIVAEEILAQIENGSDFGRMARMYSNDPNREFDGDWGWIDQETLNEELTKAAFALSEGEVSQVLDIGSNYYILMAEEVKPGRTLPFEEVREVIYKKLEEQERQEAEQRWIESLRKDAHIRLY